MALKAVRGTKDIYGIDSEKFREIVNKAVEIFNNYNYEQIITPIFEETSLFQRGIGEGTDIVDKEMYTFIDKGKRSITLRPEGTASVVRAFLEHKMYGEKKLKRFFYYGPMFRYERPQTGRYREFNQVGVEAIGSYSPVLDAEIIAMGYDFLKKIGINDIEVQINSVGCPVCRKIYRDKLKSFLETKYDNLCEDCKIRYEKNPLRVLDCKVESCKKETAEAPIIIDYLDKDCKEHFEEVKKYLDIFKVPYKINPRLVRGLDYYTNTVFEIVTNKLGAQGTVLAGGRYNNLINEMGSKDVPSVGFAAGIERLMMLVDKEADEIEKGVYLAWIGENVKEYAFFISKILRENGIKVIIDFEEKSMKANMKKASKSKVTHAVIIGEDEKKTKNMILKDLETGEQELYDLENIIIKLK
ncbi:histidine--tRNA ligase [Haliovirga abyssi]|uniref:Histidine--tRNA ligase n=2 Tax=Haliovirga abyssi TaxID=2996794 RepID=A0AAU9DHD6_9FUSO|nr:histidine--tRNA ligase [Haliovirga abyssi]